MSLLSLAEKQQKIERQRQEALNLALVEHQRKVERKRRRKLLKQQENEQLRAESNRIPEDEDEDGDDTLEAKMNKKKKARPENISTTSSTFSYAHAEEAAGSRTPKAIDEEALSFGSFFSPDSEGQLQMLLFCRI
jgi:hypothetical protein